MIVDRYGSRDEIISASFGNGRARSLASSQGARIQIGEFRADVMKDTCDGSTDPSIEPFN
jgi:hypothetical protein